MQFRIIALAMCFIGFAYVLYSSHYLPLTVVIITSANNLIYFILSLHFILGGISYQMPSHYHKWMYLYSIISFVSSMVTLFYLKKRRNRWPCVFGHKGKNFPDLEKALAAFDIEIKRVASSD